MAKAASGFVPSDLGQIVRNAHMLALKQARAEKSKVILTKQHIEQAVMMAKPLSIQDLLVEVPKTLWSEIGGNQQIKF